MSCLDGIRQVLVLKTMVQFTLITMTATVVLIYVPYEKAFLEAQVPPS